jgi:hypothetical protein
MVAVTRAHWLVWLLVALVVVLPAARFTSGIEHDVSHHAGAKHAPPAPNVFRQSAPAAAPNLPPLVQVGHVAAPDDAHDVRVTADPPFVPPRG